MKTERRRMKRSRAIVIMMETMIVEMTMITSEKGTERTLKLDN